MPPAASANKGKAFKETSAGALERRARFVLGRTMALPLALAVRTESWPIAGAFTISRGAKTEAQVVTAELTDGRHKGRGECVPYARHGETVAGVMAALGAIGDKLAQRLDRPALPQAMPASAPPHTPACRVSD